jgi:hypothetical protein
MRSATIVCEECGYQERMQIMTEDEKRDPRVLNRRSAVSGAVVRVSSSEIDDRPHSSRRKSLQTRSGEVPDRIPPRDTVVICTHLPHGSKILPA